MGEKLVKTLETIIDDLIVAPSGTVLLAKRPFAWGTQASLVELGPFDNPPAELASEGFEYVIEADEARDVLEAARAKGLSARATAELVVHYASYDCMPAWFDEIA